MTVTTVTVIKNDYTGHEIWRYSGRVVERGATWVKLEARFNRADMRTAYHTFRHGDRFVEWYYSDRWYSIFEMHDVDDDHLTGWYCNLSRPAALTLEAIRADDLALDMFVAPDGTVAVLDEEEFAALPLDDATRAQVRRALDELKRLVATRQPPFDVIPATPAG
jgi:predicted RNA-binding protein associated with RNAse of E/G family